MVQYTVISAVPQALPPILIRPKSGSGGVFDYVAKYTPGAADEICPAPLPEEVLCQVQEMALAAHRLLNLSGYSRSDFLLPQDGALVLLEINNLPGMTANSLLPKSAAVAGLSFEQVIERLIALGLAR